MWTLAALSWEVCASSQYGDVQILQNDVMNCYSYDSYVDVSRFEPPTWNNNEHATSFCVTSDTASCLLCIHATKHVSVVSV